MLHHSLLTAVVALLGLTTATTLPASTTCDATCRSNALASLSGRCHRKLAANGPACLDAIAAQASTFCSSFLTPTTVSVVATPSVTVTATATTTSTTTTTTTTTDVTTTTSTTTSTSTTTTYLSAPSLVARRGARTTAACPDLSTARLLRFAPTKVSSLCSLLGVTPSATTVSSTTTATATTTKTVLTVETVVSLTTESTTATTVTGVVATATRVVDHRFCENDMGYSEGGAPGFGTIVDVPGTSPEECCRRCWEITGCAVSLSLENGVDCQLAIVSTQQSGPGSETCPLGIWHWNLSVQGVSGKLFRGPCG
ncbi:hypothetical protein B0T18DRAFT_391446 [Schizothecium vesticola]|uniref:Apple domain-containing protein n=1 Tax=Schizothecium vesticola TaxID=314040 RepID=A0AA40K6F3_9PEZI|nr:hypothetical protein B0T18DRAFT_391446 [Schizothecium vesticola]